MKMSIFGKGRKKWLTIATMLLTILLPATVVATVIIQYQINGTVTPAVSPVIFTNGANYGALSTRGFATNTFNTHDTEISVTLGGVPGAYSTYLADVFNVTQNPLYTPTSQLYWNITFSIPTLLTSTSIVAAYAFIAKNATIASPAALSSEVVASGGSGASAWTIYVPVYTVTGGSLLSHTNGYAEIINLMNGAVVAPLSTTGTNLNGYIGTLTTPFEFSTFATSTTTPAGTLSFTFAFVISDSAGTTLTTGNTFTMLMQVTT